MTTTTTARVAVIGVGIMGSAISRRLLECGHRVSVFDLDAAKVAALAEHGAMAAATAREAAAASDFVITSLNSAAVVERAIFGEDGIAAAMPLDAKRLLIDMSSIDPPSTRRIAQSLRERTGMGFVDAPLSGGAPKALLGQLTVMAGGSAEQGAARPAHRDGRRQRR
ncbi:NAD(P)-binding domain-containing protein, partial [Variovorax sp. CAN2819]|uniref:NAD(P)-dependent oxidoreductase n=1 Tax=Variovorax sp. CAN15 TaxID=3046727 RepID=UPI00264A1141